MIQIVESNLKQLKIQRKNLLIMFQFLYRCELWYDKTKIEYSNFDGQNQVFCLCLKEDAITVSKQVKGIESKYKAFQ